MGIIPTENEIEVRAVDIIVSKGDKEGNITYANPIFFKIAGYTQSELIDKPHSIVRHPDMPKIIFKLLWDNLKSGKDTHTFVKNITKDGSFYWVYAHVRVATNPDGSFRNYVSTRKSIGATAKTVIGDLYKELLEAEGAGGMDASLDKLQEFLAARGESLATFNDAMIKIQNS